MIDTLRLSLLNNIFHWDFPQHLWSVVMFFLSQMLRIFMIFFVPFHLKSRHTFKNFYKHFVNMIHQNVHQSINIHPRATIKSELVNRFCMPDLLRCNKETIRKLKIVYQFPYTEITSHAIKTCNRRWLTCNFCVNQIFSMPLTEYSTWRIKTCHTQPTLLMSF